MKPDEFRKLIKGCRCEWGETIAYIANRAGISPSFLSQIEAGKRQPSFDVQLRLLDALYIPRTYICGDCSKPIEGLKRLPGSLQRQIERLVSAIVTHYEPEPSKASPNPVQSPPKGE